MKTPFRGLATHVVAAKRPRRGLLPGATGALATAAPSDLDAQLLWLCSALMAQDAEIDCMLADRRSLRRRPGEAPLDEDHLDAAESAWFDLIEEIAGTPARSLTGMRAKAAALQYTCSRA